MNLVREIESTTPLTSQQLGIIYASEKGASGTYIQQLTCSLRGRLDKCCFERAWQTVAKRHKALRSAFTANCQGEHIEVTLRTCDFKVDYQDWQIYRRDTLSQLKQEVMRNDRYKGIALNTPPLMRIMVASLNESEWWLLWTIHHIVVDGWSAALLLKEVFYVHQCLRDGARPILPAAYDTSSYSAWTRHQDEDVALKWWRAEFTDSRPVTPFTYDHQYTPNTTCVSKSNIPVPVWTALGDKCRLHKVTRASWLQAVWAVLLRRYSGCGDVCFGVTTSNRYFDVPDVERMVGLLSNTVPVRVKVGGTDTIATVANHIMNQQARRQNAEWLSLARIQTAIGYSAIHPLFDNIFVVADYQDREAWHKLDGALSVNEVLFWGQTEYPLTMIVDPTNLEVGVLSQQGRVRKEVADCVAQVYVDSLKESVADVAVKVVEINRSVIPDYYYEQSVTASKTRVAKPLVDILWDVVQSNPTKTAIISGDQEISFGQLWNRSNKTAELIRSRCIARGSRIGVLMRRSVDAIIAIVAILKADCAYVPFDLRWPAERIRSIADDAGMALMICDSEGSAAFSGALSMMNMADYNLNEDRPLTAIKLSSTLEDIAYVMYTSGTTGSPKGVLITHRAILRVSRDTDFVHLDSSSVIAQCASLAFDASTFEIWGALLNGGRLVLVPTEVLLDPPAFRAFGTMHAISIVFLTTALFNIISEIEPYGLLDREQVLFGGEAATPKIVWNLVKAVDKTKVIHVYGPTECTTFATAHHLKYDPQSENIVPIGRPIQETGVHVLDDDLLPVPRGGIGELFISGNGLSAGYLGDPKLTSARFLQLDLGNGMPTRVYRTGDTVVLLEDGNLQFLGRRDQEMKIRGHRVNRTAIEKELTNCTGVAQAVALLHGESAEEKVLAAFVVVDRTHDVDVDSMRSEMRRRLPEYMVPSVFYFLDNLPTNSNGKIDYEALSRLCGLNQQSTPPVNNPSTDIERKILELWCEVLGTNYVDITKSFFDVGGNSLSLVKLITRANKQFDISISVGDMFDHPTVQQMARLISKMQEI